jgi:hypothetical protein
MIIRMFLAQVQDLTLRHAVQANRETTYNFAPAEPGRLLTILPWPR